MDKTAIRNFSIWSRKQLIEDITKSCMMNGITESGILDPLPQSTDDMQWFDVHIGKPVAVGRDDVGKRAALAKKIRDRQSSGTDYKAAFNSVVEEVAYTWFNRLIAIRFMEVNDYLPLRVLSSTTGKSEPDIVTTPFETDMGFKETDRDEIITMKEQNRFDELFRMLFIRQCYKLSEILPDLFEDFKVIGEEYTELLLTISFTNKDGILWHLVHDIKEKDFREQVQIIGWLYQYWNTEPKDETFALLKKNIKITKERIPAATQLFTPDWIVRYMVENSLGRLWLEGHPDNALRSEWKYYLDEAEQEPDVSAQLDEIRRERRNIAPEEITVLDPCMGSGHILVYAFDLLMRIYLSRGYDKRDAAALILQKNLYGCDIDKRSYQLAYFSLMMKGREHDRRFLTRGIKPNICHFQAFDGMDGSLYGGVLWDFTKQFENADVFGSLLEVNVPDETKLDAAIDEFSGGITLTYEQLEMAVRIYHILSRKYDVVVTNPPYMNVSNMCAELSNYVKEKFSDYKSDLFSAHIVHCTWLAKPSGFLAFFSPYVWMFIQSYEKMRNYLYTSKTIENLIQFEYSAFEEATVPVCAFSLRNMHIGKKGCYLRLTDFRGGMEVQREKTLEAISNHKCGFYFEANSDNFEKIPGSPVAYWVSENFVRKFDNPKIGDYALARNGMKTGDNGEFVRLWWEVSKSIICFHADDYKVAINSNCKWFPYNKGGEYRKWYGNNDCVVNWENGGEKVIGSAKLEKRNVQDYPPELKFRPLVTWSLITSSIPSFRYKESCICDIAGMSFWDTSRLEVLYYLLGLCNTKITLRVLGLIAPTINFQAGDISRIPVIIDGTAKSKVHVLVSENIEITQQDWDSFETSWDFKGHPLI